MIVNSNLCTIKKLSDYNQLVEDNMCVRCLWQKFNGGEMCGVCEQKFIQTPKKSNELNWTNNENYWKWKE